ncbi:MAG: cell division protein ZapA [Pseudomonadota bacterium]|nr:cell division protein ZapA [Pseudomonadota bacterium]
MAQVEVTVNNRDYQIICDDGQEDHLIQLAENIDKRLKGLVVAVGQVGESRLLVMLSLLLADELAETHAALQNHNVGPANAATVEHVENALAEAINEVAERIESVTQDILK